MLSDGRKSLQSTCPAPRTTCCYGRHRKQKMEQDDWGKAEPELRENLSLLASSPLSGMDMRSQQHGDCPLPTAHSDTAGLWDRAQCGVGGMESCLLPLRHPWCCLQPCCAPAEIKLALHPTSTTLDACSHGVGGSLRALLLPPELHMATAPGLCISPVMAVQLVLRFQYSQLGLSITARLLTGSHIPLLKN